LNYFAYLSAELKYLILRIAIQFRIKIAGDFTTTIVGNRENT